MLPLVAAAATAEEERLLADVLARVGFHPDLDDFLEGVSPNTSKERKPVDGTRNERTYRSLVDER